MNLHGILKRHPADSSQKERIASPVEGDFSSLALSGDGSSSTNTAPSLRLETEPSTGTSSEVTTLAGDASISSAPAATSSKASNTHSNKFQRRVGFNTFASGVALEGRPTVTGGGTGVCVLFEEAKERFRG